VRPPAHSRWLLLFAALACGPLSLLHGQNAVSGALTGEVTDPSGVLIPSALIELRDNAKDILRTASSYGDSQLRFTGPEGTPPRITAASGSVYPYLGGPRFSYRRYSRVVPFAQVLLGGVHATAVTLAGCTGSLCTPLPTQNSFSLVAGGGLDIVVLRHLSIRAIQAEYMMTRFGLLTPEGSTTQSDLRLSSGLVLRLGVSSRH